MKMWDTTIALEKNVEEFGVMFDNERSVKKNDEWLGNKGFETNYAVGRG
jgi:hypothetical protein